MALNDSIPFVLDHERLEVYRAALELHTLCCALLPSRGFGVLRDQLERASVGVVLNIAEGAGRGSAADKRRFYEMARGSATESAATLEVLRLRRLADHGQLVEARSLAIRVVQMLSRLAGRLAERESHPFRELSGDGCW
jgi:four helix bundle protein